MHESVFMVNMCYEASGGRFDTLLIRLAQAALAARLGTTVTAHDMPGFGLTQRCANNCALQRACARTAAAERISCCLEDMYL